MTKTNELLAKLAAGTHRITSEGYLQRWYAARGEWVTDHSYRKDTVHRARMAIYKAAQGLVPL